MRAPEYQLQRACVDYLTRFVPEPPVGPVWTAVNPVPAKSKAVAGKSRALGMVKGWPDMQFALAGGRSFYVEFKAGAGSLSPEQRAMHHWLGQLGHRVHVVRDLAEFAEALEFEGVPVKAGVFFNAPQRGVSA